MLPFMSCTLPNSGAAWHRHATYRYPGKPLMCCAEHAEPGMVSPNQGSSNRTARPCPTGWCIAPRLPCRLAPTTQKCLPSLPAENKAWPTPQSMLCLCSAMQPWHDSRVCAAPRSAHQFGLGHSQSVDLMRSPPGARGCTCTASPGLPGRLLEAPHAGSRGSWVWHKPRCGKQGAYGEKEADAGRDVGGLACRRITISAAKHASAKRGLRTATRAAGRASA